MNALPQPVRRHPRAAALARLIAAAFLLLLAVLCWRHAAAGGDAVLLDLHAGVARDLLAEQPRGRQALLGAPALSPLPSLLALPGVAALPADRCRWGVLAGLAAVLALAAPAAVGLLRRCGMKQAAAPVALAGLALAAAALGGTSWLGLLPLLALLPPILACETAAAPAVRALAGPLWGLAWYAHPAAAALALLRLLLALLVLLRRDALRRAVQGIVALAIAYAAAVHLLLQGLVLGDPLYGPRQLRADTIAAAADPERVAAAMQELAAEEPGDAWICAGPWAHAVRPFLAERGAHHLMDYHPDKIPAWERRRQVLLAPLPGNPLHAWAEVVPDPDDPASPLLLGERGGWGFWLIAPAR